MSLYQFDPKNNAPQKKQNKSFFAEEKAVDAEKAYQNKVPNTPIVGKTSPSVQPSPQSHTPQRTSRDILGEIFSYAPPKPTYDPNRPEELKRRMKLNAFGQGLSVLGDILSLSKGGNVIARPKDRTNDELQNYIYDYTERAARANDEWNYNNYMARIKKGVAELDQLNAEKKMEADLARQKYDMWKDQRDWQDKKEKFDADQDYRKWLQEKSLSDSKESKRRWEAEFGLKQKDEEDKMNKKIQTSQKTYDLTPEAASYYRNQATLNISELQKLHPEWVSRVPVLDEFGNNTGGYTYKLASFVKDDDLIRSYLEMTEKAKSKPIPGIETSERPYFGYPSSDAQDNTQFSLPGLGGFKSTNASNKGSFKLPGF